jgi:hypothetical protein
VSEASNNQQINISGDRLRMGDVHQSATIGGLSPAPVGQPLIVPGGQSPLAPAGQPSASAKGGRLVRVLFLAANPADTSRLRIDQEARAVDDALRASGRRERFELDQRWAATAADLAESLLRFEPAAVHVSGHGGADALALERDALAFAAGMPREGHRDLVPAHAGPGDETDRRSEERFMSALAGIFASAGGGVRCVLLNACHSAPLAEAIAAHVECAIGMTGAIGDLSAILFARGFYSALGYGRSVQTAFDLARQQISAVGLADAQVPRLFGRRGDPARCVLVTDA